MYLLSMIGYIYGSIFEHTAGKVEYRVTEESLKDRLDTDMHAACHSIDKECRLDMFH